MPVDHTHQWTICVKGVDGADITHFIKKVQFRLHADTYPNALRCMSPPLAARPRSMVRTDGVG